jgi:hypothetical protein
VQGRPIKSRFRLQCSKIAKRQLRNSNGLVHHCGKFAEIGLNHPLKAPCLNPVWKTAGLWIAARRRGLNGAG